MAFLVVEIFRCLQQKLKYDGDFIGVPASRQATTRLHEAIAAYFRSRLSGIVVISVRENCQQASHSKRSKERRSEADNRRLQKSTRMTSTSTRSVSLLVCHFDNFAAIFSSDGRETEHEQRR